MHISLADINIAHVFLNYLCISYSLLQTGSFFKCEKISSLSAVVYLGVAQSLDKSCWSLRYMCVDRKVYSRARNLFFKRTGAGKLARGKRLGVYRRSLFRELPPPILGVCFSLPKGIITLPTRKTYSSARQLQNHAVLNNLKNVRDPVGL